MATFRRAFVAGGTFFFTVVTKDRQPVLATPPFIDALREAIASVQNERPFDVLAGVLLPDHMHCVWRLPSNDPDYPARWSMIKRRVSQSARSALPRHQAAMNARREPGLWQRRYWEHQIRDEADLERHIDYIHWNPVKHGLVANVRDWPHSTFHRYVREGGYPGDWGGVDAAGEFGE